MKIGKYEFPTKTKAKELLEKLDANNLVAEYGFIVLEKELGEYEYVVDSDTGVTTEEFVVTRPEKRSKKYHVDIGWVDDIEKSEWTQYRIEIEGAGVGGFSGYNYKKYKL